jgi:hypothetical protein
MRTGGYLFAPARRRTRPRPGLPIKPTVPNDPSPTDPPAAPDDSLVSLAYWPGVDVWYRFRMAAEPGAPKKPALTLHLAFDPGQVVRDEEGGVQAALDRHALIAAQLAGPGIALVLDTTVLPGEVASTDALLPALAAFAEAAVAELRTAAAGGTPDAVVRDLSSAIDPAAVAVRGDDLFAIGVRLTLSREAGQAPTSTTLDVPAAPHARESAASTALREGAAEGAGGRAELAAWARDFEEAFAGFDGADGRLRVLSRTDSPADTAPSFWALRWSRAAGVGVELPGAEAAYFTFAPLSTGLMSGSVQVTEYDSATLTPARESTVAFSSVELDAWGQVFLVALDDLLSPKIAAAIARLDYTAYAELAEGKARLARALSRRLVPVYADDLAGGDVEAARETFERALLESLASAYSTSAVVQVPASIQVAGEGKEGAFSIFGRVAARGEMEPEYSGSAATLPLRASTESAPARLTFVVSAAEPRRAPAVPVAAAYEVRGLVHRFPHDPEAGSQRLEFVLTEGAEAIVLALQPLHVPVPLRGFPAPPILLGQTATGASEPASLDEDPIRGALVWDYTAEVATQGYGAQDDLWVEVAFNLPAGPLPAGTTLRESAVPGELFQALAKFQAAWPTLAPLLPRILAAAVPDVAEPPANGPTAQAVVAAVTALVASVTERWAGLVGTADALPSFTADAPTSPETDEFVIRFGRVATGQLDVFARPGSGSAFDAASVDQWPSINDQRPTAAPVALPHAEGPDRTGGWYRCGYPCGSIDALTLRWSALPLIARQTARGTFRTVRNASLSAGAPLRTRDELVYRTAPVAFTTPVLPLIEVDRVAPLPSAATLAEAFAQVLQPVSLVGTAAAKERVLEVGVSYGYPLTTDDATLMVFDPVLQANRIDLDSGGDSISTQAGALAREVSTWYASTMPPTSGAILCLRVVLFAVVDGTRLPLVRFERVEITVPPGWWTG